MSIVEIMLEEVSVLQIPTWGIGWANLLWETCDAPILDLPALTPSELSVWMKKDIQTDNLQSSKTIASQRRWNKKRGPPLTDGVLKSRFTEQCCASTKRTYSANGESKCVCVRMFNLYVYILSSFLSILNYKNIKKIFASYFRSYFF